MKISKLLNKEIILVILIVFFTFTANAENEPVDIWNIDKKESNQDSKIDIPNDNNDNDNIKNQKSLTDLYKTQSKKKNNIIQLDENLKENEIKIYGLYDPEDFNLDLNMWSNSNGNQIKKVLSRLNKINLSKDASELMRVALLTNSYPPKIDITEKEFLGLKSQWLIKNSNLILIEEYLTKNQMFNLHPKLTKYLLDHYLSEANVDKACEILSKNNEPIEDLYLSKFNIYCLIKLNKKEEAQLVFDLKKELGLKDKYFEEKINYLLGLTSNVSNSVSEKSIFDFYLAHQSDPDFMFEPNNNTSKII